MLSLNFKRFAQKQMHLTVSFSKCFKFHNPCAWCTQEDFFVLLLLWLLIPGVTDPDYAFEFVELDLFVEQHPDETS